MYIVIIITIIILPCSCFSRRQSHVPLNILSALSFFNIQIVEDVKFTIHQAMEPGCCFHPCYGLPLATFWSDS